MSAIELTGSSRIVFIVGDPVAQVKSPDGMTRYFQHDLGEEAVVVPARVAAGAFGAFVDGAKSISNCIGIIATIPHKTCLLAHCASATATAQTVGAANVARIENGELFGDQVDGLGMLAAANAKGIQLEQKCALMLGAGGAGSAIAHTLLEAGIGRLYIQDNDRIRADQLVDRLSGKFPDQTVGNDPCGTMQILINATPLGMNADDPLAFDKKMLESSEAVLDVVTGTHQTGLISAAKTLGLDTVSGDEMFHGLRKPMADFLLASK